MKFRLALLCIVCLLSATQLYAQHVAFRQYTASNDIQGSTVYMTLEDNAGNLWFATSKGLARYDGLRFEKFGPESGLTESGVYLIVKDTFENVLWFITTRHSLFCYRNGKFNKINVPGGVGWIDLDEHGHKWLFTRRGRVMYLPFNSTEPAGGFQAISRGLPSHVCYAGNDRFLISSVDEKFSLRIISKKSVIKIPLRYNSLLFISTRIFRTYRPGIFIVVNYQFIYEFNINTGELKKLMPVTATHVYAYYEDPVEDKAWLCTSRGLYSFDKRIISTSNARLVFNKHVTGITRHSEGNYWISTLGEGVFACNFHALHYDVSDGLQGSQINALALNNRKVYALSFVNSTIDIIDKGKITGSLNLFARNNSLPSKFNYCRQVNPRQFIVSADSGMMIENGIVKKYGYDGFFYASGIDMPYIRTDARLINNVRGNDTVPFFTLKCQDQLFHNPFGFNCLTPVFIGRKTIYYQSGVNLIETTFSNDSCRFKIIPIGTNILTCINVGESALIMGSDSKGIGLFKADSFTWFDIKQGLAGNYCNTLLYEDHILWAGTNNGLSRLRFDPALERIIAVENFSSNDLLPDNEVNSVAIVGDTIYVATQFGLSAFPKKVHLFSKLPPSVIRSVQVNGRDTVLLPQYTLAYDQNNLTVEFKSISFRTGKDVLYKYRLLPMSESEVITSTGRVDFSSLPPGSYTLEVRARSVNGQWSQTPSVLKFNIRPPFWATWWFLTLSMAFVTLLIIGFMRQRIKSRTHQDELERRLARSELRALKLHMNPHFVFNTLNSLQSLILQAKPLEANHCIARFSRLFRMVMAQSEKHSITLNEEVELMRIYIELEMFRLNNSFTWSVNTGDIDVERIRIPPLTIQPFVENAIKYGLSNIDKGGRLSISFNLNGNVLHCRVEDNGPGREYIRKSQEQSGRMAAPTGIAYTEDRLKLLFKENNEQEDAAVTITDLADAEDNPCGTRVDLKIPVL